ncbi:hypothetical protein BXY64_0568 [Marinifilum flexuosum]|uniref:Uncharacterized protein n=1 Tax=Marinifilum flexuosum TaxID=1117708 RepID=A0A419X776_9BACT|nr:hypothetical protein BXY64_0568 [Marinifilum flexuosum]
MIKFDSVNLNLDLGFNIPFIYKAPAKGLF